MSFKLFIQDHHKWNNISDYQTHSAGNVQKLHQKYQIDHIDISCEEIPHDLLRNGKFAENFSECDPR